MPETNSASPVSPSLETEAEGGPVKPFLDHLEDLRWLLIKCICALGACILVCFPLAPVLVSILKRPMLTAGLNIDLNPFGPMAGMAVLMKIAFYSGLILALGSAIGYAGAKLWQTSRRGKDAKFGTAATS